MTNAIKLLSILPIKRPILFVTFLFLILHLLYSPFYLGADNIYAFAALHNDILSLLDGRVRIADNGWLKKYMEQRERYLQEEYHINAKWTKEKQLDERLSIFRLIKN